MEITIGIILIITAIFLIVAVLMQQGKNHNLSGAIAGGAETFFGKSKASTLDKKLSKATTIVAVVFVLVVLASYLMQDTESFSAYDGSGVISDTVDTSAAEEVPHDHDGDGVADHGDEAHVEETAEAAADETAA